MNELNNVNGNTASCGCAGGRCSGASGQWIWILFVVAIAGVLFAKHEKKKQKVAGRAQSVISATTADRDGCGGTERGTMPPLATVPEVVALPRFVDLGAGKCIPCKMMAPILEDLKKAYAGKIDIEFIDVGEHPDAVKQYGVNVIPTQIYYDAAGKELFRHEGFFGKEAIVAKWQELGVELTGK